METKATYKQKKAILSPVNVQWLIRFTIIVFFVILNICFFSAQSLLNQSQTETDAQQQATSNVTFKK